MGSSRQPVSCTSWRAGKRTWGTFGVRAFPTSHDVPCVGYRIHTPDGKTMRIATDLGTLTPPVHEALTGCDLVALESNYDLHMLRSGPYPYYLRARIESTRGHLSNDECAAKLLELIQEGCKKVCTVPSRRRTIHPPLRCRPYSIRWAQRALCRTGTASCRHSAAAKSALHWNFE